MWRNDTKCKYMFMFPLRNLARKGLILTKTPRIIWCRTIHLWALPYTLSWTELLKIWRGKTILKVTKTRHFFWRCGLEFGPRTSKGNQFGAPSLPMCVPNLRRLRPVHFELSRSHFLYGGRLRHNTISSSSSSRIYWHLEVGTDQWVIQNI